MDRRQGGRAEDFRGLRTHYAPDEKPGSALLHGANLVAAQALRDVAELRGRVEALTAENDALKARLYVIGGYGA